ncbi:LysR family transcriptional regulator [Pseudoalteromonas sp. SMS1]|uniref:LysR family transcriptional regulator n=1 Tax=Pseudoalteromonas sp. SMS1 TaxID=2908894 RepID=UPI001F16CCBF|nr:LysR family transcriptional regulator [Pseudoalteromonas sp. SMS1]MCF2860342.1 LysR family transcriptional regulator [Pseudoalteromonas sp. SMS1]
MELDSLRSFLAFVETGSFTRAATQMHRTQSAISMQMKKLQQDVGHTLFIKEGRQLKLTAQGIILAGYARQIIHLQEHAMTNLAKTAPLVLLHLGCPDDYSESILPILVKLLHQHIDRLELNITCASSPELQYLLDQGLLDLAVVTRTPQTEEGYLLCQDRGVWVGTQDTPLLSQPTLPIAVFKRDCRYHQAAIEGLLKQKRAFKVMANSASASALRGLIRQGLAIGAMANLSRNGLPIIEDPHLPFLPNVEIVVVKSNAKACAISDERLYFITECFRAEFNLA